MPVDRAKIPYLPERIEGLGAVATNLSWSWSRDARQLFAMIDEPLWHLTRHNPIATLRRIPPERLSQVAREPRFLDLYDRVMADFRRDQSFDNTWFSNAYPAFSSGTIAYFCAEFGLHNSVPIYSGGLGVLAGDHCKSSSDLGMPLVGIGALLHEGLLRPEAAARRMAGGQRRTVRRRQHPAGAGAAARGGALARGGAHFRARHLHRRLADARGRVPVYLLDTNLELNDPADRELTSKLYTGGPDMRLRQEWILGVGGVRVLRALGGAPSAWHANEGHAAFMLVERLRELVSERVTFEEAVLEVRSSSIFTTHTPVPAGHDTFSKEQVQQCAGPLWEELGISPERFLAIGSTRRTPTLPHDRLRAAAVAAREWRGAKHGEVSRRDLGAALALPRREEGADRARDQRGAQGDVDVEGDDGALRLRHWGDDWGSRVGRAGASGSRHSTIDDVRLWNTHTRAEDSS
jgi:starch phosphorylase